MIERKPFTDASVKALPVPKKGKPPPSIPVLRECD